VPAFILNLDLIVVATEDYVMMWVLMRRIDLKYVMLISEMVGNK
jgi:hypothetical protein